MIDYDVEFDTTFIFVVVILCSLLSAVAFYLKGEISDHSYSELLQCSVSPDFNANISIALFDGYISRFENTLITTFYCSPPEPEVLPSPSKQALLDLVNK